MVSYAVVDLETTGANFSQGDRIIQIGIVIVEDLTVVSTYHFDINPERHIPQQITQLTGIADKHVRKAPIFEDVALYISNLLEGTIFVAHNINFDYAFLSQELEACGLPPLSIQGIDTVELSRVVFPTQDSYTLSGLAMDLDLSLVAAHNASHDALATAELLIANITKLASLPKKLMGQLIDLSYRTIRETYLAFEHALELSNKAPHARHFEALGNLVIAPLLNQEPKNKLLQKYPQSSNEKAQLFNPIGIAIHQEQARFMDTINAYLDDINPAQHLFLEADTGFGKSLAYLLPALLRRRNLEPVLISTSTLGLQDQLINKTIPLISQVIDQEIQVVNLKSNDHVINLQEMNRLLEDTSKLMSKHDVLVFMSLLIWLTETQTGDLQELNRGHFSHDLFAKLLTDNDEDRQTNPFIQRRYEKLKNAHVLVTNHHYLNHHFSELLHDDILKEESPIIIDEAHQFAESTKTYLEKDVNFSEIQQTLIDLLSLADKLLYQVEPIDKQSILFRQQLGEISSYLQDLEERFDYVEELLYRHYQRHYAYLREKEVPELLIEKAFLNSATFYDAWRQLQSLILSFTVQVGEFDKTLENAQDIIDLKHINRFISKEKELSNQLRNSQFLDFLDSECYFVYTTNSTGKKLIQKQYNPSKYLASHFNNHIRYLIYVGATLGLANQSNYVIEQLGEENPICEVFKGPFDYTKQLQVFVEKEGLNFKNIETADLVTGLVHRIESFADADINKMIVYIYSKELIVLLSEALHQLHLAESYTVITQDGSRNAHQQLTAYEKATKAILIGSQQYFEGLDYNNMHTELLLVGRLPFDAPTNIDQLAAKSYYQAREENFFKDYVLPRMLIRLRQATGRLIRSKDDAGTIVFLDNRVLAGRYKKQVILSLPEEITLQEATLSDIIKVITKKGENNED